MTRTTLKSDSLGTIYVIGDGEPEAVVRDTRTARRGARWLARALAAHEARVLRRLEATPALPQVIAFDGATLERSYVAGVPMHAGRPCSAEYFRDALRLLRSLHRQRVAHNDLAKEANWLCMPSGRAAIVDFQIAWYSRRRSPLFRLLAREDLRHLLKHKRTYLPHGLSTRQRRLLAHPSLGARLWRTLWKPAYLGLSRLLGRAPRRGPVETRGSPPA
jgi:predicted Ser/Thr protein kinase